MGVEIDRNFKRKVAVDLNLRYIEFLVAMKNADPHVEKGNDAFKELMSDKKLYPSKPSGNTLSGPQQLKSDLIDWVQKIDEG